jgi:hypothetical protein
VPAPRSGPNALSLVVFGGTWGVSAYHDEQSCSDECPDQVLASRCAPFRGAEEPPKSLAALQDRVMVKRTVPIWVISLILASACGVFCQKRPSTDLLQEVQFDSSHSPGVQRQEMHSWTSLPDAPSSVRLPTQAERFPAFVNEASLPLERAAVDIGPGVRETEMGLVTPRPPPRSTALYEAAFIQKRSSVFLDKYLYPPLLNSRYYASTSDNFMFRASYAASRIFITRDGSGKGRLNTSYFLGVLASVAVHSAYRPNGTQSTSAAFGNLGSTIGGDAGVNVYHEFGPGIRQIVKGHIPKFVSRIEERITRDRPSRVVVSIPAR